MSVSSSGKIQKIVSILRDRYGEISWWPGDRDEVMIGAIFSRQTCPGNVIRALAGLRSRGLRPTAALRSVEIRPTHAHIVEYAKLSCIKKRCDPCILVNSNG
jgi:endonuclease III-like uncharacterized protein